MKKTVYVVTSYRWGNREDHSYILGVFSKKTQAIKCADSHVMYRGGKYYPEVDAVTLDSFSNDDDDYSKTIYKTKK